MFYVPFFLSQRVYIILLPFSKINFSKSSEFGTRRLLSDLKQMLFCLHAKGQAEMN